MIGPCLCARETAFKSVQRGSQVTLKLEQDDEPLGVSIVSLTGRHAKFTINQITILNPQRVILPIGVGNFLVDKQDNFLGEWQSR